MKKKSSHIKLLVFSLCIIIVLFLVFWNSSSVKNVNLEFTEIFVADARISKFINSDPKNIVDFNPLNPRSLSTLKLLPKEYTYSCEGNQFEKSSICLVNGRDYRWLLIEGINTSENSDLPSLEDLQNKLITINNES